MTIYGYARVSTDGQSVDAQVAQLRAAGAEKVIQETASGAKSDRAGLRRVMAALDVGDVLVVTRLDRLARSTLDLLHTLREIADRGAGFKSLADTWADTTTAHGRLMLTILGGLAEFERELIHTRTSEGRLRDRQGREDGPQAEADPASAARGDKAARLRRGDPSRDRAELCRVAQHNFETRAVTTTAQMERFFYHSFPRRRIKSDVETDKGCKILSLICDAGLLMAPEVVKWQYPHADGSPPRTQEYIQRRVCFTELLLCDLIEHAEIFGYFALEFEIDALKGIGALPVFYIPQATSTDASEVNSLGSILVLQAMDAMVLAMRLAGVKQNLDESPGFTEGRFDATFGFQNPNTFSLDVKETRTALEAFTFGLTPPDMLDHGLGGLLGCFYPADNMRENKALAYTNGP